MDPLSSWDILILGQSLQAQEFCFRDRSEAKGPDWNLGQFWTGNPHLLPRLQKKLSLKPAMVRMQGKITLKTNARKGLVMFFKMKQIWTYLIKPLIWFLFTPCSNCRNMDRWTQSIPGYLWGPHCHFFLLFYPLWCREESFPNFQKGNWGTKTTIQHLQEFNRSQAAPFESSWRTAAPLENLSLNLSSSNQSPAESAPNPNPESTKSLLLVDKSIEMLGSEP